ncbi:TadG family pilus assembly protein [Brevundimonas sp.]|jgi:uncharacterized membrane protein|uniref:TadG family pilus assembly protein n=1 Tax=Brevundimonas sp. TaxID=1871086 RepID=UPI002E10F8CB|nr:TadG family pilus assembly protein [Brevundimonas sp.]
MSLWRDRRGGVAVMAAASAGLVCALAAAIDVGSVALEARRLQGAADLAALSAAADLPRAQTIAAETAVANAPNLTAAVTEIGLYVPDPALAPAARFQPGAETPNAVRVTLTKETPLFFGAVLLGRPTFTLTRTARAARPMQPRAVFSLGSRLAGLDGGVANVLLTGLTGSQVSLSLMDYNALAAADVDLLSWWSALATEANVSAADFDGVLTSRIDAGRALELAEPLLDGSSRSALTALSQAMAGRQIRVGDLIALEPGAEGLLEGGLNAGVAALDLVMATAQVAGGDRQVALDLGADVGLASVTADLAIGEPAQSSAWLTITRTGHPVIRTRQTRLIVRARTSTKLAGLAQVDLPLMVELAPAEARLAGVDCGAGAVTVEARPGLARAAVGAASGDFDDFSRDLTVEEARLLSVAGLVTVRARAEVEAAQTTFRPLTFDRAEVQARARKSVSTTTIGESLVASLLRNLDVTVSALGLGLGLGGLEDKLAALLAPVGATLDGLLNPLLSLLGVRLGEADVRIAGLDCRSGAPRLVG